MNDSQMEKMQNDCFVKAHHMIANNMTKEMDLFDLTDLLISMEMEKEEKQQVEDSKIDYNDTIVEIENVGMVETVDISVTGSQLFYCNNILTKNSMGIAHTADCILGLISSEELEAMGQIMIKQLKNRWGDLGFYRRFVVGIDRSKMKLYDLEEGAQSDVQNETRKKQQPREDEDKPTFDTSNFGQEESFRMKPSWKKTKADGFI
jgi:hypothetical protein